MYTHDDDDSSVIITKNIFIRAFIFGFREAPVGGDSSYTMICISKNFHMSASMLRIETNGSVLQVKEKLIHAGIDLL